MGLLTLFWAIVLAGALLSITGICDASSSVSDPLNKYSSSASLSHFLHSHSCSPFFRSTLIFAFSSRIPMAAPQPSAISLSPSAADALLGLFDHSDVKDPPSTAIAEAIGEFLGPHGSGWPRVPGGG